jgi:hypothetical protein
MVVFRLRRQPTSAADEPGLQARQTRFKVFLSARPHIAAAGPDAPVCRYAGRWRPRNVLTLRRVMFPIRPEESIMSDEIVEKTELEKSRDIVSQLKEMQHYSKANIEKLTAFWLQLDGELKQKEVAVKIEALLTHQNTFHEALETAVTEYEAVCNAMEG